MSKYAKHFYFKEFKVEDYNFTDIIIIYNNEIRNDEFKKNIRYSKIIWFKFRFNKWIIW